MCTQEVGDMVWVPDLLVHGVLNLAPETFALTAQHREPLEFPVIHRAARHGHAADIQQILSMTSRDRLDDYSSMFALNSTPLLLAAEAGHAEVIALLCDAGANIEMRDPEGLTPLLAASHRGKSEAVRMLLYKGAVADVRGPGTAFTALHIAARRSFHTIAEDLLGSRADVNALDIFGNTPLHVAATAQNPSVETIALLLRSGANVQQRNTKGLTPRDLAGIWRHPGLRFIEEHADGNSN